MAFYGVLIIQIPKINNKLPTKKKTIQKHHILYYKIYIFRSITVSEYL